MITIFDLDNCLSNDGHRVHLLNEGKTEEYFNLCALDKIGNYDHIGETIETLQFGEIAIFTERPDRLRNQTVEWLKSHGIETQYLFMRPTWCYRSPVSLKLGFLEKISCYVGLERIAAIYDDDPFVVNAFKKVALTPNVRRLNLHNKTAYYNAGIGID